MHVDIKKLGNVPNGGGHQVLGRQAGITVQHVLTDNGSCYRSRTWANTLAETGIAHKRTRPYRPQTNGKVERFNRTLLDEWAYARPYRSEQECRDAFPIWLHNYNHHRRQTLKGLPPAGPVPNRCTPRRAPGGHLPWSGALFLRLEEAQLLR